MHKHYTVMEVGSRIYMSFCPSFTTSPTQIGPTSVGSSIIPCTNASTYYRDCVRLLRRPLGVEKLDSYESVRYNGSM